MADPFDAGGKGFLVLINADGQSSLWPALREAPHGSWREVRPIANPLFGSAQDRGRLFRVVQERIGLRWV